MTQPVRGLFDKFVKEVNDATVARSGVFRPIPPMIGDDGKCVDLYRVFVAVWEMGGHEVVSQLGFWNSIGENCGLGSGVGALVKLIHCKYLLVLDKWLTTVGEESGRLLGELKEDLESLLSVIEDAKKKNEEIDILNLLNDHIRVLLNEKGKKIATNAAVYKDVDSASKAMDVDSGGGKNIDDSGLNLDCNTGSEVSNVQTSKDDVAGEGSTARKKRKRKSRLEMLNWLIKTAKNPCDPAIGILPDRSKWKSYGNDLPWKQVLSVQNKLFFKPKFTSKADKENWLKKKMTPSMYELRVSKSGRRLSQGNKSLAPDGVGDSSSSSSDDDILPESKFLGCGCPNPGSVECVRFHISEINAGLNLELGTEYHHLGFDYMEEKVACNWTSAEKKKFQSIVDSYPTSELLEKLLEAFPTRSKTAIVSYYYNVCILRHRAYQNEHTPPHIDSVIKKSKRKR